MPGRIALRHVALCCTLLVTGAVHAAPRPLVVHEWGTFTSFQDERGRTIEGINVDDEPVPRFVHRLYGFETFRVSDLPATWSQGAPRCHPGVTMRLETPVVYFYPPQGWQPRPFDVQATFVGGWLTEFYPFAETQGMNAANTLDTRTRGRLLWKGLRFDPTAEARFIPTASRVWLAPRRVRATPIVSDESGQSEKYLFYRGVGHLEAPVVVRQQGEVLQVSLRAGQEQFARLPRLWLVDVAGDGHVRMSARDAAGNSLDLARLPERRAGDASALGRLRGELRETLTRAGLYPDEADAMLETWRLSYFESAGLRLFFTLPRAWIDAYLPLEISAPSDITRVMVGRIELVSPEQRAILAELGSLPAGGFPANALYRQDPAALAAWRRGVRSHAELYRATGRPVPRALELYESLGRFRDALLAHESRSAGADARRANLERALREFGACIGPLSAPLSEPVLTTKQ